MISENGKVKILEKYINREKTILNYNEELKFYNTVKLGNVEDVEKFLLNQNFEEHNQTPLSDNLLQSLKYHLTVSAAMLARFCIEGGMEYKRAYELSDHYIRLADKAENNKKICSIHIQMCLDYTKQMKLLQKKTVYSKQIVKGIDYIFSHLHDRLTVENIANAIGLNKSYFSRLFHKETGQTVNRYILLKKIEAAQNLLKYSDYSCSEISELLSFSTQSHFISRFKDETGMTPLSYRNKFFNHTGLDEL